MSQYESSKHADCYSFLNSMIEYIQDLKVQLITYEDLKKFTNEHLQKGHSQDERERYETLTQLIFKFIDGKASESVLRFYLKRQFVIEEFKLDEIINKLNLIMSKKGLGNPSITFADNFSYPKVSVIITTYNRKDYLFQAINSILAQDYPNIEIITIDDNSSDGTDLLMAEHFNNHPQIIYIRKEKNCGPGTNRREAFQSFADGEYTLFLDDDDYLIDYHYISKTVHFHMNHPEVSFVAANVFFEYSLKDLLKISDLGLSEVVNKYDYLINFERPGYPKPLSTLTTVFKRDSLIEMGILNMNMVNDASIYMRALLVGHAGFIDSIVGVYRIHGNNITFNLSKEFIVENLDEKTIVKNMAIEQFGFNKNDMDNWFNYTVHNTVSYYLVNSARNAEDFRYMFNWTKENCPSIYHDLRNTYRFTLWKKRLKRFPLVRKLSGK
ncbi:glycosyltransferase family 2 protein [Neobacillus drentensis]|uniref:glycosyltransferase family 2 protein n=1 Tax=Neobacillus drentensis TaxID=220684 RepID=UPI002FFDDBB0